MISSRENLLRLSPRVLRVWARNSTARSRLNAGSVSARVLVGRDELGDKVVAVGGQERVEPRAQLRVACGEGRERVEVGGVGGGAQFPPGLGGEFGDEPGQGFAPLVLFGFGERGGRARLRRGLGRRAQEADREQFRDGVEQFAGTQGFFQEGVAAGGEHLVLLVAESQGGNGQDAHGVGVGQLAQFSGGGDAVGRRHAPVEQHEVGLPQARELQGGRAVGGLPDGESVPFQKFAQQEALVVLVVHDEQAEIAGALDAQDGPVELGRGE